MKFLKGLTRVLTILLILTNIIVLFYFSNFLLNIGEEYCKTRQHVNESRKKYEKINKINQEKIDEVILSIEKNK